MNLLFTGRGKSGSWQIRGEQLGHAIGATVKQGITVSDCKAADLIVVVKRAAPDILDAVRKSGRPWAFDVLDFFPQPVCTAWSREQAIDWVQDKLRLYAPTAILWPNEKMRRDCDIGLPGMVLKHHHRPGIRVNPIRKKVQAVGYEGSTAYLGEWRSRIEDECSKRGWQFIVNPHELANVDIVLAVRDKPFAGYAQTNWKSGIKISNAHGSGTPFVGARECGYIENASGAEYWADDMNEMRCSFDWLITQDNRQIVSDRFLAKAYCVEQAGSDLETFLRGL